MFTKNIKDSFTANLLSAVSGVLGEAKKKKCAEGCECEACEAEDAEETQEGYMPTNDMPSAKDRATAGKLGALLKRERSTKEKKETNGVKTEEADMPFEKPYRKAGERKDEYGNKVKNVAKHLAKKAMKANEEVEDIEEKRGLWDNIHAKRKRIKAGSGERMRKPGSEGAPSAADLKASQTEEMSIDDSFEQIDEISKATMGRYINKAKDSIDLASYRQGHREAHGGSSKSLEKKLTKRHKGIETAVKKLTKEDAEQIDELSKDTMGRYINKAKDSIDLASYRQGHREAHGGSSKSLEKKLTKRHKGIETAVKKLTKEDAEQIDELSKDTMGRYINKAATKMGSQGVTAGLKIAADEKSSKNFKDMGKREKGIKLAVSKLTKEEQDFIDALNADTLDEADMPKGLEDRAPRGRARNAMGRAITKQERNLARARMDRAARKMEEEVDLDEARGRPKKAGARDFTIHPKTKEKLMHDNPSHMKKIEALQKTGMLQKPKTEASQHIMNQLSKAKTSMRGGETINFTHGDSKHVSGTHAAKLLDRYAGMKPDEKEAFQKKIGHSHAKLKSEL